LAERKFLGRLQSALASDPQPACLVVSQKHQDGHDDSANDAGSTRLSAASRAATNGLVEKSYFLDFFEAFLAVFFVLFLAVFFLAAM